MIYLKIFNKKSMAFTLAEVLITLAIIGVVASLTIPSAITNYQKQQTVVKLKKTYSELQQAIKLSEINNGTTNNWTYTLEADVFMKTYLEPYFKNLKKDKTDNLKNKNIIYKHRNGTKYTNDLLNKGSYIILSNGVMLFVDGWYDTSNDRRCLAIDINGYKEPNMLGKDVFGLYITKKGILRNGYNLEPDTINNDCKKTGRGTFCLDKIMQDNWQIKDDYPW